jgi:hypothetical protein
MFVEGSFILREIDNANPDENSRFGEPIVDRAGERAVGIRGWQ